MPHGNHKENTYKRYTKEKERSQNISIFKKSMKHKGRQEKRNKGTTRQKTINQMAMVSPSLSIITLNVDRSNSQIKRHRVD